MLTQNEFNRIMIFFEEQFAGYPYEFLNLKDICKKYKKERGSSKKLAEITEELKKIFIKELRHVQIDTLRRLNAIYRFRIFFPKSCHEEFMEKGIHVDENGVLQELDWTDTQYFGEPKSDNVIGYLKDLGSTSLRVRSIEELAKGYKEWREANLNLKTPIEVEPYLIWRIPEILKDVIETPNLTDVAKVTIMMLTGTPVTKQFRNRLNKLGKVIMDEEERIVYFKEKDVELQQSYETPSTSASETKIGKPRPQKRQRSLTPPDQLKRKNYRSRPRGEPRVELVEEKPPTLIEPEEVPGNEDVHHEDPQQLHQNYHDYEYFERGNDEEEQMEVGNPIQEDRESTEGNGSMVDHIQADDESKMKHISGDNGNQEPMGNMERKVECHQEKVGKKLIPTVGTPIYDYTGRVNCQYVESESRYEEIESQSGFVQHNFESLKSDTGSNEPDVSEDVSDLSGYASPEVARYFREREKRLQETAERLRNRHIARAEAAEWNKSTNGTSHRKPHEEEETCSRKKAMRLLFRMYDSFQYHPEIEENEEAERKMYEDARESQISMRAIIEALKKSVKDIESCLSLSELKDNTNSYSCETIISLIRQMAMGLKSSLSGEIIQISYILQTKKATERILIESLIGILSPLFLTLFTLPAINSEEDRELNNQMVVHISGNDGNRDPIVDEEVHATESSSSNSHELLYSTNNEERKIECFQGNDETKLISTVQTHIDDNTGRSNRPSVESGNRYKKIESQNEFVQQNFESLKSDTGSNEPDGSGTEKKLIESQGNTIGTSNGDDDSTVRADIPATETNCPANEEMDNGEVDVTVENTSMSTDNGATVSEKSAHLISCPVNQSTKNIPVSLPEAKRDAPAVEQQGISETETNSFDGTSQKKPQEEEETYDRKEAMRLLFRIYDSLQYNSEIEESAKRVKRMCEYANGGRISMKSIIMLLKKSLGAIEKNLCLSKLKNNTNSRVGDSVFSLFRQMAMGLESSLSEEIIQTSNILQDKKGTERILIEQLLAAMSSMFLDLFLLPAIDSEKDRQRDDQYEMIRNSSDERNQEQIVHNVPVMESKSSSSNKLLDSPNNKETKFECQQQNVEEEKLNSTVQTQIGVETVVDARQSVGSVSRYGEIQSQNFESMELGSDRNDETSINTDNEVLVSEKATSSKIFPVSQSTEYIPVPSQAPSSSYHASIPEAETDAPTTEQQGISGTEVDKDGTSQKIPQEEETYDRKKNFPKIISN